jgi:hypothetical protein
MQTAAEKGCHQLPPAAEEDADSCSKRLPSAATRCRRRFKHLQKTVAFSYQQQ